MTYGTMIEALAVPTRRAVFERITEGPVSVSEIASSLPVSRPAVSQHLRVLKEAGLVIDRREGVRRIYVVDHDALRDLRDYFDGFWSRALENFKRTVEEDSQ